jgi:hypothetical protein
MQDWKLFALTTAILAGAALPAALTGTPQEPVSRVEKEISVVEKLAAPHPENTTGAYGYSGGNETQDDPEKRELQLSRKQATDRR